MEKHISVRSNDPLTPEVSLTIKVNYTPFYELNPMTLAPNLAFGMDETNQFTTADADGRKTLADHRLEDSAPWITAALLPEGQTEATNARIRITIKREGTPRRFNEYVHIYTPINQRTGFEPLPVRRGDGRGVAHPGSTVLEHHGATPTWCGRAQITQRVTIRSAERPAAGNQKPAKHNHRH